MEHYSHNTAYMSGSREPRFSRAATVRLTNARRGGSASAAYGASRASDSDTTGVLRGTERPAGRARHAAAPRREQSGRRPAARAASRPATQAQRAQHAQRPRAAAGAGSGAAKKESVLGKFASSAAAMGSKLMSSRPAADAAMGAPVGGAAAAVAVAPGQSSHRRTSNFMHYANDNRVVRAVYEFTHGATKPLFILIVVVAVLGGLYFPVRDLYVAKRTGDILAQQVEIRKSYNDSLQKDVDKLLSEQGIKDTATDKLGLVMPGEKKIDVVGLDDDSSSSSAKKDSEQSKKASEVKAAEEKVAEDAPWYVHALDAVFGFTGVEGQEVSSSGN